MANNPKLAEVGAKTRFKQGNTLSKGKGHPKGQRNLSTILREMLSEFVEVTIDGKKAKVQFQDVLVRKLVKKANEGDLRAIQECFNRTEGMPKQKTEVETTGNITINWIPKKG